MANSSKRKLPDRVAAGFFLWLIAARARFSDGQNSGVLTLDTCETADGVNGYLEANVARTKSSMTLERKTRFLPMAGAIRLLSDEPWAVNYLEAMLEAGLIMGADKPLLPSPAEVGWGSLPITAEAATAWLKALLVSGGSTQDDVKNLGTHSCKITALSWASKAGVPKENRPILGYHSDKKSSVLVYGRDNQAEALRQLDGVFKSIADGKFHPDHTRSGYFTKSKAEEGDDDGSISASSSSEDSADEEQPEHAAQEEATEGVVGTWNAGFTAEFLASMSYFRHSMSRVIHVVADEGGSHFFCGRSVSLQFIRLVKKPAVMNPLCKQCFASFSKEHQAGV